MILPREQIFPIKYRLKLNDDECSVLHAFIPQEYWDCKKTIYTSYRLVRYWVACEDVRTLGVLPEAKLKFPDHVTTIGFENLKSLKMYAVFQDIAKTEDVSELLFQFFHPSYGNNILEMTFEKIKICRAQV